MGTRIVSADSADSDSDNENADIGSEDVGSEEEPSEEEEDEEDPDEDEPQEVDSNAEADEEDSCGAKEENLIEQELDEAASCEVEPDEELVEEPCEEEPDEEPCEVEPDDEASEEEPDDEACEEEPDEEIVEEEPDEEELVEEEPDEEEPVKEESDEEEPDEELDEDPEEELSDEEPTCGSSVNQSYDKNNNSAQFSSGKMNISSNITSCAGRPSELSCIKNSSGNVIVPEKLPANEVTGKKRRRRWDISENEVKEQVETGKYGQSRESEKRKTRRSRWSSEDSQHSWASTPNYPGGKDLETPKLLAQLFELTKKLQSGIVDDRLESERSPSPPPLYNNLGFQINTREARLRSKLMKQRQEIIKDLMKNNPNFKPPPDYKTNKLRKKVYIPVKENPGYNFIGLILGPRGKTQKQMEEETGAKIVLRGKGSSKDSSDDEDLHVLIEADDRYSLDAAVSMVEKLLIPVEDGHNVHKLKQLRELAELNGTLRNTNTSSRKFDPCNVCGDKGHPTFACPLTAPSSGANSKGQKVNFFAEMGGGVSPFSSQPPPVQTIPLATNFAPYVSNRRKEIDDANLFVGQLPPSVDNTKMRELFSPFGLLCEVKVIRDKITGLSKGYGFVKYADHVDAAKAVANMNGCKIEGKTLVVRIAGIEPLPSQNNSVSRGLLSQLPTHSGSAAIAPENSDPMHWPGPPESRLPESLPSFSNNSGLPVLSSPFNGQYLTSLPPPQQTLATSHFSSLSPFSNINSLPTHNSSFNGQFLTSPAPSHQTQTSTSHFSGGFATPEEELLHFPGYLKSFDPPPPMPSTSLGSSQFHFPQNFGSYQMPPS